MTDPHLTAFQTADAVFLTDRLLTGGDLDTRDRQLAASQLHELAEAGVSHIVDARIEWSDEQWVTSLLPDLSYLHHGMDDAGQRVPAAWFEAGVSWVRSAIRAGGTVLVHCHMGINRGPSLAFAVLLDQGWRPIQALDLIRAARPIAWVGYAEEALRWHHERSGADAAVRAADAAAVADWRRANRLDLESVIRQKRASGG